jgi:putative addiction module component (TIGR02574 family)
MQTLTHEMADKARTLPDSEKLTLVDQLLSQLDRPDPEIDRIWAEEARKRWQAYRDGRVASVPYAEVMAKYKRP